MDRYLLMYLLGIRPILSLNEVDLKRSLLDPAVYDKTVRPRTNASHTVNVQIGVTSVYVVDLNEKQSSFSQAYHLSVSWQDDFLMWNASDYEDIASFVCESSSVWTPDVTLFGRMETNQGIEFNRVRVRSDGGITTTFMGLLTTYCSTDPSYFPFDYQFCILRLGSQVYSMFEVVMEISSVKMLSNVKNNPNWDLTDIRVYDLPPGLQTVFFCLQRKPMYLSALYMVPTLMHAVLVLVSYMIPSETGEKISFGVSLFLSFMVFLLQLNGDLPEVSTSIPALEVYYMLHMVSGIVSVVVSIFTAYVIQETNQSPQSTLTKIKDVSMVLDKKGTCNRRVKWRCCNRLRSSAFLNRLGFVLSFILILIANIVMLNAKLVSTNCVYSEYL